MDYWRKYFRSANSDIFDVIEHAIVVAASDWPQEFRAQRDRIAEKLFSCQLARCRGCDRVGERDLPQESNDGGMKDGGAAGCAEKESKIGGEEAEALTEETEEESQMVRDVFRIKEILSNKDRESDSVLFESMKRLQSMALSVDVLKVTEIGKAVNGLRKHRSREIRHLVRALIDGWKVVVDEWVHSAAVLTESTPESMNPCGVYNGEELPSPALDEGQIISGSSSLELSQFFDGMDDAGNLQNGGSEPGRKQENRGGVAKNRPTSNGSTITEEKGQVWKQKPAPAPLEPMDRRAKLQEFFVEPVGKPQRGVVGDVRPRQRQEPAAMQKKPAALDKCAIPEESSVRAKLEVAKRKLHERYQQAETEKKQRTIQVMELQDIPNQSRQQPQRPDNQGWSWTSGRR